MKKTEKNDQEQQNKMPLTVGNYRLMLIGLAVIILGFVLMAGGKNPSADVYNYEMFSLRRISLAPLLVVAGFAFEIYAIMKRYDKK